MSTISIAVKYVTYLDEYRYESWPETMGSKPIIGDRVRSEKGRELQIVFITHTTYEDSSGVKHPVLEILLAR